MIAVDVLVQPFGKPAPDFPYRGDHYIETTNYFSRRVGRRGTRLLAVVAFKREDPHNLGQVSMLDETVLLQNGALGFAWLSKVS